MLPRLSRARVPLTRYLQTNSARPQSSAAKYAFLVGGFTTIAVLGTVCAPYAVVALDSPPSQDFGSKYSRICYPTRETHILLDAPVLEKPAASQSAKRLVAAPVLPSKKSQLEPAPETAPSESELEREQTAVPTDGDAGKATGDDSGGGAFNPETGEINWDCPCLGGMAHGPCGPEFREAFSCFVYSEDEPKGINCVEKFQGMQNCFREHPEIYASGV
jgi:intermembrane space import and assembly protein 40